MNSFQYIAFCNRYIEYFYMCRNIMDFLKIDPLLIYDSEVFKDEDEFYIYYNYDLKPDEISNNKIPMFEKISKMKLPKLNLNTKNLIETHDTIVLPSYNSFVSEKTKIIQDELQAITDIFPRFDSNSGVLLERNILMGFNSIKISDRIESVYIRFSYNRTENITFGNSNAGIKIVEYPKDGLFSDIEHCVTRLDTLGIKSGIDFSYGNSGGHTKLKITCLVKK